MKESNFDSPLNEAQKLQEAAKAEANQGARTPEDIQLTKDTFAAKKQIQEARAPTERQWLVNIAFLYGKQHFEIDRTKNATTEDRILWELKTLDRKKKNLRTVNYILPLYRSLLSRMLMLKQRVIVDPLTNQQRDISAARVAEEVLEDVWLNINSTNQILRDEYCGMLQVIAKLFGYFLCCGYSYLMPKYNPKAKAKVQFDKLQDQDQKIQLGNVGAVETEVDHAFNVFEDPMGRFKIVKRIMAVDTIKEIYGKDVKPDELSVGDVEKQLMNLLEGNTNDQKYKDAAEVLIRWDVPNDKRPNGRLFACTKDVVLLEPQDIPEEYNGQIPIFKFKYLDLMLGTPQGLIEQLIPSQEELNTTVTRIAEFKKWLAGKILVPDGCNLETRYDDQTGQIIKYNPAGGKPEFQSPPNPPSILLQDLPRIQRNMEDIAATHDASQGRTPAGIKANSAIQSLSELDQSQLSPVIMNSESQLGFFCEMVLGIIEKKYTEQRLIGIAGKDLAVDVKTFKGSDVAGNRRIRVTLGSNLPVSREARQETLLGWLKLGLITKEEARDMLEFGTLDGVYHNIDDQAEKMEIQEMLNGIEVVPMEYENHTRRLKLLTDFMMSEDFRKIQFAATKGEEQARAILTIFTNHRKAHQEFLMAEMRAMQGPPPGQGAPQPGAPAPV